MNLIRSTFLMTQFKNVLFLRHYVISDIFIFFWFLGLILCLTQQRIFPYIYDDEYGVLGAAAVLAGLDWTTPPNMPFYGFLLSLFIAPFYKLNLEPTFLYQVALSINGLLVALSALMALRILRRLFCGMTELTRILVVIAAFSYLSVAFYAGLAMGETTLLFTFTVILYGLTLLFDQQKNILGTILLAIGLGLTPYAHTRGLAFWLAAAPIILWVFWNPWPRRKLLVTFLVVFLPIVATLASVKSWLIENFYSVVRTGTGSATEFASAKIMTVFLPERWADLALTAYGQFAYLASASFGLVIVGLVGIIAVLRFTPLQFRRKLAEQKGDHLESARVAIASFVGLSFLVMFFLSVLSLAGGSRVDHVFYGRYNEVLVPTLIIAGLVFIFSADSRLKRFAWTATSIVIAVFLTFGIRFFSDEVLEREMIWNSLSGWFVHIQGKWKIEPTWIAFGTLSGGVLLLLALGFSRKAFTVALSCIFIAGVLHNYAVQHGGADRGWGEYGVFGAQYKNVLKGQKIDLVANNNWRSALAGEALQFSLPHSQVRFVPSSNQSAVVFDTSGSHCNEMDTAARIGQTRLCVYDLALLASLKGIPRRVAHPLPSARTAPPARLKMQTSLIEAGGLVHRACAFATPFFYMGWARYCLPSVTMSVEHKGLRGDERQYLGGFITDQAGHWLSEWRVPLDMNTLILGQPVVVRTPVRFPGNLPSGDYKLHMAIVDETGWDWRSIAAVNLHVK